MVHIPAGTLVEVWRTKLVHELCVVTNSDPLILRRATLREQVVSWFRGYRARTGELAAAQEAMDVIDRAKEKA